MLTVGRDIVKGKRASGRSVGTLKQHLRFADRKTRRCRYLRGHHFVAAAIKQFLSARIPDGFAAAFGGDLIFAAWPRVRLHVNFVTAGLVGHVGEPATIRRKSRSGLGKGGFDESLRFVVAHVEDPNIVTR